MKRTPVFCLLAAFVLLLASCKNGNKADLFIPKEAAFVFHVNTSSLSSKLSWDEIKKTAWFQDAYKDASKDSFAKKLLDNPDASGVDVKSDFVFFVNKRGRGGYSVFEGSVKDAAAFEALVKKMSKQQQVQKDGDWNIVVGNDNNVAIWNNSKFAVLNDMPISGMNPMKGGGMNETVRFGADSLKLFAKQVVTLSGDASLYDDDRFADVMKENGDMHLWINSGVLYSDMAGMLSMMKVGSLLEGNISAGTISFEDGKISGKMKQFFGEDMQKAMDKWKFKNVDASVFNRIPSQDVVGVLAMNMDPEGLREFIKALGVDGFANMALSKMEMTLDEVLSATKGQFLFAVSDLKMKDTTYTFPTEEGETPQSFTSRQPDMNFLFATSVNNKASFDKVMKTFTREMGKAPFAYQLNNDWFVAGNKPESVNAFAAGNTNSKKAFTDKISGHPFGFYLDIQRILKTDFGGDASAKAFLAESAAIWKDVTMIANEYKNGIATSELEINMVDTKTNSLKQLNQYIERMNAARKANKVAYESGDGMDADTTTVTTAPPPPMAEPEPKH